MPARPATSSRVSPSSLERRAIRRAMSPEAGRTAAGSSEWGLLSFIAVHLPPVEHVTGGGAGRPGLLRVPPGERAT